MELTLESRRNERTSLTIGLTSILICLSLLWFGILRATAGSLARRLSLDPKNSYDALFAVVFSGDLVVLAVLARDQMMHPIAQKKGRLYSDTLAATAVNLLNLRMIGLMTHVLPVTDAVPALAVFWLAGSTFSSSLLMIWSNVVDVVWEATAFRFYLIESVERMTGNRGLAGTLSVIVSVAAHLPAWGVRGSLQRIPFSILLAALYIWRRSLPSCLLAHGLQDGEGFVLRFLPQAAKLWFMRFAGFAPYW